MLEIDEACEKRIDLITRQMAKQEGVTEALKATDQMEWVRHMNSIRSRAEEIVLTDCETFIYAFRLAAKIMIDILTDGAMKEI